MSSGRCGSFRRNGVGRASGQQAGRSAVARIRRLPGTVPPRTDRPRRMSGARTGALRAHRQTAGDCPRPDPARRLGRGDRDPNRQRHRSADRGSGAAGSRHMRGTRAVRRRMRSRPHRLALYPRRACHRRAPAGPGDAVWGRRPFPARRFSAGQPVGRDDPRRGGPFRCRSRPPGARSVRGARYLRLCLGL